MEVTIIVRRVTAGRRIMVHLYTTPGRTEWQQSFPPTRGRRATSLTSSSSGETRGLQVSSADLVIVIGSVSTSQAGPSLPTELTSGQIEVTELNWWDHTNNKM